MHSRGVEVARLRDAVGEASLEDVAPDVDDGLGGGRVASGEDEGRVVGELADLVAVLADAYSVDFVGDRSSIAANCCAVDYHAREGFGDREEDQGAGGAALGDAAQDREAGAKVPVD